MATNLRAARMEESVGRTTNDENKDQYLRFRITPSFRQRILELKSRTPGCEQMELQQFVVRLIELGILKEEQLIQQFEDDLGRSRGQ